MFQTWRWKLRAAREACDQGRLDEALERLNEDDLRQFKPARPLLEDLAEKLSRRALRKLEAADPQGAWRDFRTACGLAGETPAMLDTRRLLVEGELEAARQRLASGQVAEARATLERLVEQRASNDVVRGWLEVARRCEASRRLWVRGQFAEAEAEWRGACELRPEATFLATRLESLAAEAQAGRNLTDRLQAAAKGADWGAVRPLADELLQTAPECEWARDLRRRAWAHMAPRTEPDRRRPRLDATQLWRPSTIRLHGRDGEETRREVVARFLLWVDAVGGFLVCLADEVTFGQAAPGSAIDVPILGDLSRRHATVRREGENYLLAPQQPARVRGQLITQPTLLRDGDEVAFGEQVRTRFRQPHVLSASARFDWVSRHRSQPSADGVLLMAESLVLGPERQSHVVCRNWEHDVVVYRRDDQLFCRSAESIEVDGHWREGEVPLTLTSRVAGRNFAISLEPV